MFSLLLRLCYRSAAYGFTCCISSDMSAFLMTALRSDILPTFMEVLKRMIQHKWILMNDVCLSRCRRYVRRHKRELLSSSKVNFAVQKSFKSLNANMKLELWRSKYFFRLKRRSLETCVSRILRGFRLYRERQSPQQHLLEHHERSAFEIMRSLAY